MTMLTSEKFEGLSATGVEFFQAAARKGALSMEVAGMRRRGRSAYSICKQVYGFSGSKGKVLLLMDTLVECLIAEKKGLLDPKMAVFVQTAMKNSRGER